MKNEAAKERNKESKKEKNKDEMTFTEKKIKITGNYSIKSVVG